MRTLLAALLVVVFSASVPAQEFGVEIRGGGGLAGYTSLDQLLDPLTNGRIEDVSVDLIWSPPVSPLFFIGSPGVEVGATANFGVGENLAHINVLWHNAVPFTSLYVEGGIGAASLGFDTSSLSAPCAIMPYFTAGVGAELGDNWSVNLGVDHANDFGLCGGAPKTVTKLGAQVGFRF